MSHYFDTGFAVRQASWHGQETLLADYPNDFDEARVLAGLDWEPELRPLYYVDEDGNLVEELDARRVVRNDRPAREASIGTVSGTFELITHAEMGLIVKTVLGEPNVKIETMGSVRDGAQVYVLIRLDEPYEIKGDRDGFGDQVVSMPYFAVLNSHTGIGACKGLYTQVRVVCANTVQAASLDGDRHGAQFSLHHTSGVKERFEKARHILEGARADALRWKEIAEHLALQPVTDEQQLQFLNEFIPEPPAGITTDRVKANIDRDRGTFLHLLRDSATNTEIQHNALGLFNASVEYLDHVRGFRNRDTHLGRQILKAEPMKARALALVRELAGVN